MYNNRKYNTRNLNVAERNSITNHIALTEELKELLEKKLRGNIKIEQFIKQTRKLCTRFSNLPPSSCITEKDIHFLKMLSKDYLEIILSNPLKITYDDVVTLLAFNFERWVHESYVEKMKTAIRQIPEYALNLKLCDGDFNGCQEIIILFNNANDFQEVTSNRDLLKKDLIDFFEAMINKKFLKAAVKFLESKINPILAQNELEDLLHNTFFTVLSSNDIDYLREVVKKLKIDFKNYLFSYKHPDFDEINISVTSMVLYLQPKEIKEKYLIFLKNHRIHPDSDQFSDHFEKKLNSMTALLLASNRGDLESTELLIKYGADINQALPRKNNSGEIITFRTPFSVSFGTGNLEFVKNLVYKLGADPLMAISKIRKYYLSLNPADVDLNFNNMIPIMGGEELLQKIGQEKYQDYVIAYHEIIENRFLELFLQEIQTKKTQSKKQTGEKQSTATFLPSYNQQLIANADITNIFGITEVPTAAISANLAATSIDTNQELLNDYIAFKEDISQKNKNILENRFDILLLNYIQKNTEENLRILHSFICENPELEFYLVTSILKNVNEIDDVKNILMQDPQILHKFFILKKQHLNTSINQANKIIEAIPSWVYKVQSKLKHTLYIAISPEVEATLMRDNQVLLDKMKQQLKNCKIISTDSKNLSGIKIIKGIIKLKIASEDIAIATNVKYHDVYSLSTFVMFDKIIDHKYKYNDREIRIENVSGFSDIFRQAEKTRSAIKYPSINPSL